MLWVASANGMSYLKNSKIDLLSKFWYCGILFVMFLRLHEATKLISAYENFKRFPEVQINDLSI